MKEFVKRFSDVIFYNGNNLVGEKCTEKHPQKNLAIVIDYKVFDLLWGFKLT